jgi:hypoxanthine phosphoribosyltransferase
LSEPKTNINISEILITSEQINEQVKACGKRLTEKYKGTPLMLVGLLKGSFMFLSDLSRAVEIPCVIDFITTRSYGDGMVHDKLTIESHIKNDISAYHVVIAEDIIDSGRTLLEVSRQMREKNPLSLEIITLLDKPSRREVDFHPDETLFSIEDRFVVGYGLDYAEMGRNLPYIAVISEE